MLREDIRQFEAPLLPFVDGLASLVPLSLLMPIEIVEVPTLRPVDTAELREPVNIFVHSKHT